MTCLPVNLALAFTHGNRVLPDLAFFCGATAITSSTMMSGVTTLQSYLVLDAPPPHAAKYSSVITAVLSIKYMSLVNDFNSSRNRAACPANHDICVHRSKVASNRCCYLSRNLPLSAHYHDVPGLDYLMLNGFVNDTWPFLKFLKVGRKSYA